MQGGQGAQKKDICKGRNGVRTVCCCLRSRFDCFVRFLRSCVDSDCVRRLYTERARLLSNESEVMTSEKEENEEAT